LSNYLKHYNITFLDEVNSTNTFLKEEARSKNLKAPYCVSAAYQHLGKGQREKSWHSNKDENIVCSFLVDSISKIGELPKLNKAASLAIHGMLTEFGITDVSIKWPNDVYVKDVKIAGVLPENIISGSRLKNCIIGVGLNVNQTEFSDFEATSMKRELLRDVDSILVLHKLYDMVYYFLSLAEKDLGNRFNELLYKKNKLVTFQSDNGIKTYQVLSVLENGNLLVKEGQQFKEVEHHKEKWQV
jgi:BirA family biotin operon repressor/biotin-[acetyl-CoA-carboxylase] ligase